MVRARLEVCTPLFIIMSTEQGKLSISQSYRRIKDISMVGSNSIQELVKYISYYFIIFDNFTPIYTVLW